jgi:hypothetical protein
MKRLNYMLAVAGVGVAMLLSAGSISAQPQDNPPPGGQGGGGRGGRGGPGGDPAQFQQRLLDSVREQMAVKDDAEWKIIADRITKVSDARREIGFGGSGMRRMFRPPGGDNQNNDQGNRRRFGPEPSAEEQALEKAIDSKASKEELKAAMTKFRAAKKDKEAKLEAAQAELLKVVDTKQEALLLSMGILK